MEMLMAITYSEDGSKKVRKGNKKKNTVALIRRIEDMKKLNESEIIDAIKIIEKTSGSRRERQRRMNNFLNDTV
tara:strand:- start:77 stop:298 length:222 start_codon:yes stop_codon:yes gene_type:complete